MLDRREFSKCLFAGGALLNWRRFLPADQAPTKSARDIDLLIKGGTVVDPSQQLHGLLDVAVRDGRILELSSNIAQKRAGQVISATNQIVTPGLIDVHAHCYDGVRKGINADHYCLARGVTTVIDAGSTGYAQIANFCKYIVDSSTTRIKALVNIYPLGEFAGPPDSMETFDWLDPVLAAQAVKANQGTVVGMKVLLGGEIQGFKDIEILRIALEAAEIAGVPLMAHIDGAHTPLQQILKLLRKGDVYTHFLNSHHNGVLDESGKILPAVHEARQRGVFFDVAEGNHHLSFDVAEKCLKQGFAPDTLSTDLTQSTVFEGVRDLPTVVSKFLAIGLKLDNALQMVTSNPARIFNYGAQIGTLRTGAEADIAIFELQEGKFDFRDGDGNKIMGRQKLRSTAVVRHGRAFSNEVTESDIEMLPGKG